jgi:hypothetical protein
MQSTTYSSVACLSPPDLAAYGRDYHSYLQAFDTYLTFLDKHPGLRSLETGKPVRQPSLGSLDETITRFKAASRKRQHIAVQSSPEASSDEGDVPMTPATTVAPDGGAPVVPPPRAAPHARREMVVPVRPTASTVLASVPTLQKALPVDAAGAVLMGKKKCKAMLGMFCDSELTAHLIGLDEINRYEPAFLRMLDSLEKKWKKNNRVLLGLNKMTVAARGCHIPIQAPGRMDHPDFDALFESGASGSDHY